MFIIMILFSILSDGGPIYAETNTNFWIVEPYNAISSLAYLLPVIFWLVKLKGNFRTYPFLISCLPLLAAGGIGSTLYHAFRSSPFLLFLDVFPIALVTLMVSVYFWIKILPKWWHIFLILIPFFLSRYFIFRYISGGHAMGFNADRQTAINISYFISGVMIFLPAVILIVRDRFNHFLPLVISCVLFILGLIFREVDSWNLSVFPMGAHWLWHISTAAGAWLLGDYLYMLRQDEMHHK